jgi:hypothetical protein
MKKINWEKVGKIAINIALRIFLVLLVGFCLSTIWKGHAPVVVKMLISFLIVILGSISFGKVTIDMSLKLGKSETDDEPDESETDTANNKFYDDAFYRVFKAYLEMHENNDYSQHNNKDGTIFTKITIGGHWVSHKTGDYLCHIQFDDISNDIIFLLIFKITSENTLRQIDKTDEDYTSIIELMKWDSLDWFRETFGQKLHNKVFDD